MNWVTIPVSTAELSLRRTLVTGQAFRWKRGETERGEEWTGAIGCRLFTLAQGDTTLSYIVHNPTKSDEDKTALEEYFQLSVSLSSLYRQWSDADNNFRQIASSFPGVRLLCQDPLETLIAFICSSNNNVPRISLMMNKLCQRHGKLLGSYNGDNYYAFPELKVLARPKCEEELREMGFGYRAKFVQQTAKLIHEKPEGIQWLIGMRDRPYPEVWAELQQLPGVGAKVADCVCLTSLNILEAIPVDTHIWQIAVRDYGLKFSGRKTLTAKVYQEIGDYFRSLFGEQAGWAQAVLFAADLKEKQRIASSPVEETESDTKSADSSSVAKRMRLEAKLL